jgi:carbon monoxide dehydrogenase subunit G
MDMTGEYRIAAPRTRVWEALNDPDILKQCIPSCEDLEKLSDTEYTAKVVAKVGPVKAKFSGKVTLGDLDPPNGYTITGEGSGGAAGFGKGGAKVNLTDAEGDTVLAYTAHATVGGKLAQIGSRLVDATARKMADEFFAKFTAIVGAGEAPAEPAPKIEAAEPPPAVTVAAAPVEPPPPASMAMAPASAPAGTAERNRGLQPAVWITGVIVLVAILIWLFT